MLASAPKRCRAPSSDSDDYLPAAHNYQLAPMKALLRSARRDFYLQSLADSIKSEKQEEQEDLGVKPAPNSDLELGNKCRKLAELIANSRHLVAFTGAGISTSVGIPDYRGEHGIRTKNFDKSKLSKAKKRRKTDEDNEEDGSEGDENDAKMRRRGLKSRTLTRSCPPRPTWRSTSCTASGI